MYTGHRLTITLPVAMLHLHCTMGEDYCSSKAYTREEFSSSDDASYHSQADALSISKFILH